MTKAQPKGAKPKGRGKAHFLAPGTAVFIGERKLNEAEIHLFVYDANTVEEAHRVSQAEWRQARDLTARHISAATVMGQPAVGSGVAVAASQSA
ncbi:MAG: hypothetical protein NTV57_06780 [Cyanobacteria bacterium]|nr:hypothetical protein [Cyanobacteriota bacterium]